MSKKIKITCEWQTSSFCKKNYEITSYNITLNKRRNNGKYRCKYCGINETHLGEKSHYHKYKVNHDFFKEIDSEVKAYLLGIIAGDGHVSKNGKAVGICANLKDTETLELFLKEVMPEGKILHKSGNCKHVLVNSKELAVDICKYLKINPGKKSDKITLPDLSEDNIKHFIRGLIDTDGCIDNPFTTKVNTPRCYYSSTSKLILSQIKNYFEEKGLSCYISGIKLNFVGKNAKAFMNFIYNDGKAEYSLSRKKAFYDIWKTWKPFEGTSIRPSKKKLKRLEKERLEGENK